MLMMLAWSASTVDPKRHLMLMMLVWSVCVGDPKRQLMLMMLACFRLVMLACRWSDDAHLVSSVGEPSGGQC